jgi:hypothetical protein
VSSNLTSPTFFRFKFCICASSKVIEEKSAEASFGLKLTSEGNALITKGGLETDINVTLTWELKKENAANLPGYNQ